MVWARDTDFLRRVENAIASSRRVTLDWVSPDLSERFDSATYVRQLFETSFRFEVRPESRGRAEALYLAQASSLVGVFQGILEEMAAEGRLTRNAEGTFSLVAPVATVQAFRRRLFLEWSRVRATARWPKHALTFDGWLDYIVKKAERHSGETIELSSLEQRFPFIFLWPRAFRFLLRQSRKGRPV